MLYRVLADLILTIHFAFVLFVGLGGFLVFKWKHCAWVHVPAFLWAALIEFAGWICPLTPLETWLREKGGGSSYSEGFLEHYLFPVLYPAELTRNMQITLGIFVLSVNLGIYGWALFRSYKDKIPH